MNVLKVLFYVIFLETFYEKRKIQLNFFTTFYIFRKKDIKIFLK